MPQARPFCTSGQLNHAVLSQVSSANAMPQASGSATPQVSSATLCLRLGRAVPQVSSAAPCLRLGHAVPQVKSAPPSTGQPGAAKFRFVVLPAPRQAEEARRPVSAVQGRARMGFARAVHDLGLRRWRAVLQSQGWFLLTSKQRWQTGVQPKALLDNSSQMALTCCSCCCFCCRRPLRPRCLFSGTMRPVAQGK